jgi:hypothetical protein
VSPGLAGNLHALALILMVRNFPYYGRLW